LSSTFAPRVWVLADVVQYKRCGAGRGGDPLQLGDDLGVRQGA
jgi:hypothetical protein